MLQPNLDPHALAIELSGLHLIDGALVPAQSGKSFPVLNPATGRPMGQAADGDAADVDLAVASAKRAQTEWKTRSARERGKLVAECGRLLEAHAEELGRLVALESGKALRTESRVEGRVLADTFTYFGGLGSELKGETIPFSPKCLTMTVSFFKFGGAPEPNFENGMRRDTPSKNKCLWPENGGDFSRIVVVARVSLTFSARTI